MLLIVCSHGLIEVTHLGIKFVFHKLHAIRQLSLNVNRSVFFIDGCALVANFFCCSREIGLGSIFEYKAHKAAAIESIFW